MAEGVLDVEPNRILLTCGTYTLDLVPPYAVAIDDTVAQFNRRTRHLTITLPVAPECE
jgi:hypothetical protein